MMGGFKETLGPRLLGAEILVRIARRRFSGTLLWSHGNHRAELIFVSGRPQVMLDASRRELGEKEPVVEALRAIAVTSAGVCEFEDAELSEVASKETLRVDTLGEVVVAIVKNLKSVQLDSFWDARLRQLVSPNELFERLSAGVGRVSGVHLDRPSQRSIVGSLISSVGPDVQRTWAALLVMGALDVVEDPSARPTPAPTPTPTPTDTAPHPQPEFLPEPEVEPVAVEPAVDSEMAAMIADIKRTHESLQGKNHYEVLKVDTKASKEQVAKAYLSHAKSWHTDRFAGADLDAEAIRMVDEIFMFGEEAHRILSDEKERDQYDFIQERVALGLPTDAEVILKAEDLFRQAQMLVRRGNAGAAEPLLREAVELNPGEPEFWAYFGWAVFSARGAEGANEARHALDKAEEGNEELDVIYEFRGRIARLEDNLSDAVRNLKRALSLNPDNTDAARELRVLAMRHKGGDEDSIVGKLKGMFGKK